MNMLVFNFLKMMDMHKGYAYQFLNFITYKKIKTKNLESYTPRTKPKHVRDLNPSSMKSHRTLPNCNPSSLTQPRPTQTHPNPQN